MEWELKVLHSACIHYLTAEDIQKEYHMPTLPYPLLKHEVQLIKQKYLPECPTNELGGYEQVPITDAEVEAIQENQPAWRVSWLGKFPKNKLHYLAAPQELRIDPTFCPMKRRRNWDTFQRANSSTRVT